MRITREFALLFVAVIIACVVATAVPARAQDLTEADIQIASVDSSEYPEVTVTVRVPRVFTDVDLRAGAFALSEGGVEREVSVEKVTDPVEVVIVLDTSSSMEGEPLRAAKAAATTFLDSLPANATVSVVGFGGETLVAASPTTDSETTAAAIEALQTSGDTALYDAVVTAADLLVGGDGVQSFVVVLSDGADTMSSASIATAAEAVSQHNASLYAVGLQSPEADLSGLSELASRAGGNTYSASELDQLGDIYDSIAGRVANTYDLSFAATSDGPVVLRVVVLAEDTLVQTQATVELSPGAAASPVTGTTVPPNVGDIELGAPASRLVKNPGFVSEYGLYIGGAAFFIALAVVLRTIFATASKPNPRKAVQRAHADLREAPSTIARLGQRFSLFTDRVLENQEKARGINRALDSAGINMRPGEFVAVVIGASLGSFFVFSILFGPIGGLVVAALVVFGSRVLVNFKANRRRTRFADQLPDTLMILASTLRAGYGVQQALNGVTDETESPTKEEFTRAVVETRIGRDLGDALEGIYNRVGNEDFLWVIRAIGINRELGGDLAEILDNVGETIRDRAQVKAQVRSLTAEGRLSALVLMILPIFVAGFIQLTNPGYINLLFQDARGWGALAFGATLLGIGGLWIKKIVNIRY